MAINLGATAISDVKLGSTQVDKIYLGTTEVWSKGGGGTGTDYGKIWYYDWDWEWQSLDRDIEHCEITAVDSEMVDQYVQQEGLNDPVYGLQFYSEDGNTWESYSFSSSSPVTMNTSDLEWMLGITVVPDQSGEPKNFHVMQIAVPDTTGTLHEVELTQSQLNDLTIPVDAYEGGVPKTAIIKYEFGTLVTSTPSSFLIDALYLTSLDFTYATALTTIGSEFLFNCTSFNGPLNLSHVTNVGDGFLKNCKSFNQPLTLPALNIFGYRGFMHNCDSMTSTISINKDPSSFSVDASTFSTDNQNAAFYTTGFTFGGAYAANWHTRYPDSNQAPYRKSTVAS